MKIIVMTQDVAPRSHRFVAMRQHDWENYEPEYPAGSGARPREAVDDLMWHLDVETLPPDAVITVMEN
jgi:hypothetical protein